MNGNLDKKAADESEEGDAKSDGNGKDLNEKTSGESEAGDAKSDQQKAGLKGIVVNGLVGLLGILIGVLGKGQYDLFIEREKGQDQLSLERQKLDSELVKYATEQPTEDKSGQILSFMVNAGLIRDEDIKNGVSAYLKAHHDTAPATKEQSSPSTKDLLLVQFAVSDQKLENLVHQHRDKLSDRGLTVLPTIVDQRFQNAGNIIIIYNSDDIFKADKVTHWVKEIFSIDASVKPSDKSAPLGYIRVVLSNMPAAQTPTATSTPDTP
jgi:hypothetical protein